MTNKSYIHFPVQRTWACWFGNSTCTVKNVILYGLKCSIIKSWTLIEKHWCWGNKVQVIFFLAIFSVIFSATFFLWFWWCSLPVHRKVHMCIIKPNFSLWNLQKNNLILQCTAFSENLNWAIATDLYKRLDCASIIWAPPEIEAGSYVHLRPNL